MKFFYVSFFDFDSKSENTRNAILVKDQIFLIVDNNVEIRTYLKSNAIDLIPTDYMMPKMSGLQLITILKV